jgi:hypothetical protein
MFNDLSNRKTGNYSLNIEDQVIYSAAQHIGIRSQHYQNCKRGFMASVRYSFGALLSKTAPALASTFIGFMLMIGNADSRSLWFGVLSHRVGVMMSNSN